jgi:hypothetical protein
MFLTKKTALQEALGLLKNLKDNLSGKDGYIWLEALKQFLRKEKPEWKTFPATTEYWKTIQVGTYKSPQTVKNAYESLAIEIYGRPQAILDKLKFKDFGVHVVNFGLFTIMDLGFSEYDQVTYKDIVEKAQKLGLKKCTAFDALSLRAEFKEQPVQERNDEHVLIGMDVIDDQIFELSNNWGTLFLSSMLVKAKFGKNKFGRLSKFVFRY